MGGSKIVAELAELRRGRGLVADDLHTRVGPGLWQAAGILGSDTPAAVRRKLVLYLTDLCGQLPDDLRLAALAALALHQEAEGKYLNQRIDWLASHFDRDPRTARRRIDQAFQLLSQYVDDQQNGQFDNNPNAPSGWYVESMRAMLRMDLDPAQLTEERRIVAVVDQLDEIVVSFSAPKDATLQSNDRIVAEMIYGGEIVEEHREARGHARFVVRLPHPLNLGQRHEYGIRFVAYPRASMRPYYVLIPYRRCEHFTVRVRFGVAWRPSLIWRLNGIPSRVLDDFTPRDDLLTLDPVSEITLEFHHLTQGLSYGLQWASHLGVEARTKCAGDLTTFPIKRAVGTEEK